MSERPTGLTRDAGWQIGVSRTFRVSVEDAWDVLVSTEGLALWLGAGVDTPLARGQRYQTHDGTTGEIRSVRPRDRVRLTWQPEGRPDDATVQVTVTPAASGCTVRFHTDRLYDGDEREAMRAHWRTVADRLGATLVSD